MNLIYETCKPRPDVESGATKDEQFAADLAKVVTGKAPREYGDPAVFFEHTYPTRGLKTLLKAVCQRLSGKGGEVASIIRLHTQYGGGKTHGLIALVHGVRGMKGVVQAADFVDPALLPPGTVRVAALDGENSDPANGLTLEGDLRAYSIWGELAYRLGGRKGYERVAESDKRHVAPGADTISELFDGEPTLIMLDEVSVYLRKVEQAKPGSADQFTAFMHALLKAVSTSPNVALVYTLAVGKDEGAKDAYKREHERALVAMAEAESVAARQATQLNPTEEDETADVLRRRLFERVDASASEETINAYVDTWSRNRESLPSDATLPETRDQFKRSYPLHPELLEMLTEKTSSLSTFQRTRGMLRVLARTVHLLWQEKPQDAFAIHTHHLNPGFTKLREEILVKLQQGEYAPALKSDIASTPGDEPSLAEQIDRQNHSSLPVTSYLARTVFWHTLAYGEARGVNADHLRFAVCSPAIEPAFVEQARLRFVQESLYLDDKPGAPMRFMVEPNLTQVIRREMDAVDASEVRAQRDERIRSLFNSRLFQLIPFPGGPYEVPDETSQGEPLLIVFKPEVLSVPSHPSKVPSDIEEIFQFAGQRNEPRKLRNNLVFIAADEKRVKDMDESIRRHLALGELRKPDRKRQLADYQEKKVDEEHRTGQTKAAIAILQCYCHLFYPHHVPMSGTDLPIAHTVIELQNAADSPGNGQQQIERILHDQKKLLTGRDQPDAPSFLRDQTQLKAKGEVTVLALRDEYRRSPKMAILQHDTPFLLCVRDGIQQGVFIYREGNQVWGPGDPAPGVELSDTAFVHTMEDAKAKKLWPRPQPLAVTLRAEPQVVNRGDSVSLVAEATGGVGPFRFVSSEPALASPETSETRVGGRVSPTVPTRYEVEVIDARGDRRSASADVQVAGSAGDVPIAVVQPKAPAEITAEGPLSQALAELWEKTRKAKHKKLARLAITFHEPSATWKVHQALATLRNVGVSCSFEADMEAEGIEEFSVKFVGQIPKANAVKGFLDPQLRSSDEFNFKASYSLEFAEGLPLDRERPEQLAKELTRFGGGEAYVEAHAARPEE